jgi:GT2 family glycosyltransferase
MNSARKLTFIITTFNSAEVIDACLNKINFSNYEVIVIDNNSNDKTTEIVSQKYPLVTLIKNKKNYGYGRANNIGLRATTTPYALILNPDAFIFEEDLEKVIAIRKTKVDSSCPNTYKKRNKKRKHCEKPDKFS